MVNAATQDAVVKTEEDVSIPEHPLDVTVSKPEQTLNLMIDANDRETPMDEEFLDELGLETFIKKVDGPESLEELGRKFRADRGIPPRCSWLSRIELARRPLCDESYDGNGDGTPRPSVPQVMTMLVAEGNRLSSAAMAIRPSIEAHIAWLKGEPGWEPGTPAGVPSLHHRPSGLR